MVTKTETIIMQLYKNGCSLEDIFGKLNNPKKWRTKDIAKVIAQNNMIYERIHVETTETFIIIPSLINYNPILGNGNKI